MSQVNRFGLKRSSMSASLKREVRKRCGFGCVKCGLTLFEYEHFEPEFKDAKEHRAEGITLLCYRCHGKKTGANLDVELVKECNSDPYCLRQGFASETFEFGRNPLSVTVAGAVFTGCLNLIIVNGKPILSIQPPESERQPYRLSGLFANEQGDITLQVQDNEWRVMNDNWDVECVKNRTTIRSGKRLISLVLVAKPPSAIVIERIDMQYDGVLFQGDLNKLTISSKTNEFATWHLSRVGLSNCFTAIAAWSGRPIPHPKDWGFPAMGTLMIGRRA